MPFGLKKSEKSGGDDLDKQKSSLFGSKNKASRSPAPPSNNPYAVPPPANDPYARQSTNPYATQQSLNDPYAPKSQSSFSQPPTSSFGSLTLNSEQGAPPSYGRASPAPNRYEKSPVPQGGYGGPAPPRFQNNGSNYGHANGYGSDPYGSGSGQSQSRAGGYGGLGRTNSHDTVSTEVGRQALFGDAPQRAQQTQQQDAPPAQEQSGDASYGNSGGYGYSQTPGAYGYGEDRQLTAEEIEDQEVEATKGQIRDIKRSDVATTRNAARVAEQIEQTGRDTLARLGRQGDMLHNAEGHLDRAKFENLKAEEKAKELKTLNRSMFAVHVGNPFTKEKRLEKDIQRELEKRQHERNTIEQTREAAYGSEQRKQQAAKDVRGNPIESTAPKRNLADRSKFQFEADSDDDQMEDEIEDNLAGLHNAAKTINRIGQAMGTELKSQNDHLTRISGKTDKVDDQIAMNRARLDRIK
ncbi:Protein transport protein S9 plasma membrane t-SNARE [Elasticomyces elasticus]|nr:Protein transport protein S9 plasma membrane t-SNARE [Elasticomyces elasticus]KAK3627460.1 Protein transport protein S9 plasma membrane t-SNARE [Elasticomyces elasticus]KAK4907619.1 Protein transport protein S9 plasma membrane t-SNARE [Elasticomyces elasticus]KAK5743022.1 Protein transport protein S9 plasma membrane t-SNARE [Elasticomyces elasticus]